MISYPNFQDIIELTALRWEKRKYFLDNYNMIYPKINQSTKFKYDYIFFNGKGKMVKTKNQVLDEIADNISGKTKEFYSPRYYYQRVSQSKSGSFYVILRKKRGRLTQIEKSNLIENI